MNAGCSRMARCSGINVVTPSTSNSESARSIRRRASSRSASQTTSLATIGSYRSEIVDPSWTPESTRTPGPDGSR